MIKRRKDYGSKLPVSEADFSRTVVELAQLLGWRVAHFRPGLTSRVDAKGKPVWVTPVQAEGKGFPDLVLVKGERLLFAELKSATGKLTPEQQAWLDALRQVPGIEAYVWRPTYWYAVEIALRGDPDG